MQWFQTRRFITFGVTFFVVLSACGTRRSFEQSASANETPASDCTATSSVDTHPGPELHRLWIDNNTGGQVRGSRDGGATWTKIGSVVKPVKGGIWRPTVENGVLAFNFLRGPSSVFASAVNAMHVRFSDPAGYQLPEDFEAELVEPRGFSYFPVEELPNTTNSRHAGVLSFRGGTGIFGPEWAPKVNSQVFLARGQDLVSLNYPGSSKDGVDVGDQLVIVTLQNSSAVEWIEFDNQIGGMVLCKQAGKEPSPIAKVLRPVQGIGRFGGSEYIQRPGTVRANHAGVLDIGTTDINTDPAKPGDARGVDVAELRGGIQIVPSHHWRDRSMNAGSDHPFVYMVVGPIQDPVHLKRYDMGIDGRFPLFNSVFQAGSGVTYLKFKGDDASWIELNQAVKEGRFKTSSGKIVRHLRGYIKDAMIEVTAIRFVNKTQ